MSYETLDREGATFGFPQEEDFDIIVDEREKSEDQLLDDAIEQARVNPTKRVGFKTTGYALLVPIPLTMPTKEIYALKATLESAREWFFHSPANSTFSGMQFLRKAMTDKTVVKISGDRSDLVISAVNCFAELVDCDYGKEVTTAMATILLAKAYGAYAQHEPSRPGKSKQNRQGWRGPQLKRPGVAA